MSILDAELILMDTQNIARTAGDVVGESVVYIPAIKNFKGSTIDDSPNNSGKLFWNAVVEGTDLLAGTTGSTVTLYLMVDTDNVPTTGGTVILTSQTLTVNDTTTNHPKGTVICSIPLPAGSLDQYFGVLVTIGTQTLSAGAVTSWIGSSIQQGQ